MKRSIKDGPRPSTLEQALGFLALAHNVNGQSSFAHMEMGDAQCFNLIVGLGIEIEEDLSACPMIGLFESALHRCGENFVITQLSPQKLLVRSGDFHAYIPCEDVSALVWCQPDAKAGVLDNRFMGALEKVAGLASTTAETVLQQSIQLNNGSVRATNNTVMIEAWHGLAFPSALLLPKYSYNILRKTKKKIVSFGIGQNSLTFYFEDHSWMFTKLFQDRWPESERLLTCLDELHDIPSDFFAAVKKVSDFSVDGRIYVQGNQVSSHPFNVKEEGSGLALSFRGIPHAPRTYFHHDLALIARHALRWNEAARHGGTFFEGINLRGLIHHAELHTTAVNIAAEDEDIPF